VVQFTPSHSIRFSCLAPNDDRLGPDPQAEDMVIDCLTQCSGHNSMSSRSVSGIGNAPVPGSSDMEFVGGGRGAYVVKTTYRYVGVGAGEYKEVEDRVTLFPAWACAGLVMSGVALLLLALSFIAMPLALAPTTTAAPTTITTTIELPTTTTKAPYDCSGETWKRDFWTIAQKDYCCKAAGLGCQNSVVHEELQHAAFDCNKDFQTWEASWAPDRKEWCCKNQHRGCTQQTCNAQVCDGYCWHGSEGMGNDHKTCRDRVLAARENSALSEFEALKQALVLVGLECQCQCACQEADFGRPAVVSSCMTSGRHHISSFDNSLVLLEGGGAQWLVKSDPLKIQAKFTKNSEGILEASALAITGESLQHHTLMVEPLDEGRVTWDGDSILNEFPAKDKLGGGLVNLVYDYKGDLFQHLSSAEKRFIHAELPNGVQLEIARFNSYVGIQVSMTPASGGQDGLCGNFNKLVFDDMSAELERRKVGSVGEHDLFSQVAEG